MSLPTIAVRVAWPDTPFIAASACTWTDIMADVLHITITRGKFDLVGRYEAGTCVLEIDNSSGNYWPGNTGGAYYPNVAAMKRVNVQATYGATTYNLYTGFIEILEPIWMGTGGTGARMRIHCVDLIGVLAKLTLQDYWGDTGVDITDNPMAAGAVLFTCLDTTNVSVTEVTSPLTLPSGWATPTWAYTKLDNEVMRAISKTATEVSVVRGQLGTTDAAHVVGTSVYQRGYLVSELTGARVGRLLDYLGWNSTERDIDAGQLLNNAEFVDPITSCLEHLYTLSDIETGQFIVHGDGYLLWRDMAHPVEGTSIATFGDTGLSVHEIVWDYNAERIYNDIRVSDYLGIEYRRSNSASIAAYGQRILSSPVMATSAVIAQIIAAQILWQKKDPQMRADNITILPQVDPTNLWPLALDSTIGTVIALNISQASSNEDYYIEGVIHDIDAPSQLWRTKWQLSPAS